MRICTVCMQHPQTSLLGVTVSGVQSSVSSLHCWWAGVGQWLALWLLIRRFCSRCTEWWKSIWRAGAGVHNVHTAVQWNGAIQGEFRWTGAAIKETDKAEPRIWGHQETCDVRIAEMGKYFKVKWCMSLEKHFAFGNVKAAVVSVKSVLVTLVQTEARAEKRKGNELYRQLFLEIWAVRMLSREIWEHS